ncbi:COX15/CtaA family protein [Halobacillus yeomjeoni]|uniref:Heme A synthase n=1 Tax=Halobacillus yeomjeoni TaxID=311194 RepID=A0A931HSN5_9BACI|nr:heme A synthase [Halobacillus yeomjeoni]MBH0229010.1 heme A synthase [Halobacillus yeomjeoni]
MKWLKTTAVAACLGMLLVLLGGALVTKTESGMGCGKSWPLCHGQLIPSEIDTALIIELSHRVISGGVGLMVLLLSILAWKMVGHVREVKFLSFLAFFFLLMQGLIGAAAVKWGQSDFVLAMHFGISLVSFSAVLLLTIIIFEIDRKFDAQSLWIKKDFRIQIYMLTLYTLGVVYSGALVRHTYSSMACLNWPFCSNASPLDFASYGLGQWIQMGHRFAASIVVIWTLLIFKKAWKEYRHSSVMTIGWGIGSGLLILQVILGALVIVSYVHLGLALLHALVISLYVGLLSYFLLLSSRSSKNEKRTKKP